MDKIELDILQQHATQVEVPRGSGGRMWLGRSEHGWRLYGTYGPTWAFNFATKRWEIMTDPSKGHDYWKRAFFFTPSLREAFTLAAELPNIGD